MNKMWMLGCAVALGLAAPAALYGQCCGGHDHGPPPPPPCFKEVPLVANVLVEKKVDTCECVKKKVWPIVIKEVKGCVWEDALICRSTVHDVPVCKSVPVCVKDPCTGCTKTEYHQETVIEKVVSKEYAIIPVKKEYDYNLVSFDDYVNIKAVKKVPELCFEQQAVTTKVPCDGPVCPSH